MSASPVLSASRPRMREFSPEGIPGVPARRPMSALLRFTSFALFFFPASMVIEPIGASGTVPMILALLLLLTWVASSLWGLHDPVSRRSPMRLAAGIFVLGVLAAYVAVYGGWSGSADAEQLAASDRWAVFAFASVGLVVVVGDTVRTMDEAMQLTRWLLAGGFFSCLVGVVQFVFHVNPMEWIQLGMPGFTYNGGDTPFQDRGNLTRVAGSTFHSIEFGVTSAMLLPLSIWRGLFDTRGAKWFHWLQTLLLAFAVAATISRSGTLAVAVALAVLLPFLPRLARRRVLLTLPFAVLALFLVVPGFVGSLTDALTADSSDPSISTRLNNYPRVAQMIDLHPLFGIGPGAYLPTNALNILDNEYLNAAVCMGMIGLACVVVYLILPGVAALHAARHAVDPALRCLAAAVAAGLLVAAVCSATFDSLSFPVFALLFPLMVGMGGSVWNLVSEESHLLDLRRPAPSRSTPSPAPLNRTA